jgi:N utilization substance protein A
MVVSELRGEKIDIIPWNTEPARFVAKALSPARVREVYIDDDTRDATVVVPDDQLALAIGKEGLNARLATRLTGWKIDIKSDTEFAEAEAKAAFAGEEEGEDFSGRCAAILSNGKRCPNAALPGSKYCGVPAHQDLANRPDSPELVQAEEEIVEVVEELATEDLAAAAALEEAVDGAVEAGDISPEDGAMIEAAIEEAAAEALAEDAEAGAELIAVLEEAVADEAAADAAPVEEEGERAEG